MSQTARFAGKAAFVTGASSGIGRATAQALAREGASVAVADVAADGARETARLIEQDGGRALALSCDVADGDQIQAALAATIERFARLDIAFNNAGVEQPVKPAHEITDQEFYRLIAVNLRGTFVAMKQEIEFMLAAGGGSIVNTSSGAGVKGFKGQAAYAATKHGLIGLTKSAALDYAARGRRSRLRPRAHGRGIAQLDPQPLGVGAQLAVRAMDGRGAAMLAAVMAEQPGDDGVRAVGRDRRDEAAGQACEDGRRASAGTAGAAVGQSSAAHTKRAATAPSPPANSASGIQGAA
jgi:NAD(P)-dependent dehydrogenase (short-subunit alcohol dehydrogenase family)